MVPLLRRGERSLEKKWCQKMVPKKWCLAPFSAVMSASRECPPSYKMGPGTIFSFFIFSKRGLAPFFHFFKTGPGTIFYFFWGKSNVFLNHIA